MPDRDKQTSALRRAIRGMRRSLVLVRVADGSPGRSTQGGQRTCHIGQFGSAGLVGIGARAVQLCHSSVRQYGWGKAVVFGKTAISPIGRREARFRNGHLYWRQVDSAKQIHDMVDVRTPPTRAVVNELGPSPEECDRLYTERTGCEERLVWNGGDILDFDLSDDQQLLSDTSARFIEERCPLPHVRELAETPDGIDPDYLRQAAELGWFAMLVDEEHGGGSISGRGVVDAALVAVQRGRFLQPGAFVPGNVVAWALARFGNDEQRAKVLPSIVAGESIATWAAADPIGNWDPGAGAHLAPTASGFSLAGTKGLVQDAHLADWLLVTAQSEGGPSQVLVSSHAPGVGSAISRRARHHSKVLHRPIQ